MKNANLKRDMSRHFKTQQNNKLQLRRTMHIHLFDRNQNAEHEPEQMQAHALERHGSDSQSLGKANYDIKQ